MQKYFSQLKRGLAAFLAVLTLFSVMPLQAFAVGDPDVVTCKHVPDLANAARLHTLGDSALLHIFTFDVGGTEKVGFCYDHSKHMGSGSVGDKWKKSKNLEEGMTTAFLSYYYTILNKNKASGQWGLHDTKNSGAPGHTNHAATNGWVQALVWELKGKESDYASLFNSLNAEAGYDAKYGCSDADFQRLKHLGQARVDAYTDVAGAYYGGADMSVPMSGQEAITDSATTLAMIIAGYKRGDYGHKTFALYNPVDKPGDQPMIVPVEPPDDNPGRVWAKIRKIDENGNGLPGAEFTFSYQLAGGNMVPLPGGVKTTDGDGWAYVQITPDILGDLTNVTIYAKETKAPAGYKLVNVMGKGDGNTTDNATQGTAVDLKPGGVPNPKDKEDGDSDILEKVDARTNKGVGPAVFTFEGQSNPNQGEEAALIAMDAEVDPYAMSAMSVQYAAGGSFEKEVAGSTGFAPRDLQVTLADGSKGTLKAGTAFTIVSEEGANWKFKTSEKNGSMEGTVASADCMINLPDVLPSIEYDILNASSAKYAVSDKPLSGVTGQNLYGNLKVQNARLGKEEYIVPIMYPTAKKWAAVQNALQASGDGLIFYDAYRPFEVQQKVKAAVDAVKDKSEYHDLLYNSKGWHPGWFISQNVSNHQRGTAADVGLKSARDTMPSQIHDLSVNGVVYNTPSNNPPESDLKASVKNNAGAMKLHTTCMNAGLSPLASEWWHFDDDATQATVKDKNKGTFFVSECLSVAPEDAATQGGTGSSAETPSGGGGTGTGGGGTTDPGTGGGSGTGSGSGSGSGSGMAGPGAANDGYYKEDWKTDDNGLLHLQWTDPKGENYIPPGEYTVTEKTPPPGYDHTDEARHIVLNADGSFSGKLIFKNNKLRSLQIMKVSIDNQPLEGAQFDIMRDGKLVTSGTTGPDGTFTYSGAGGDGIESGLYCVKETAPPPGHLLPYDNVQWVDIRAEDLLDNETVVLTFKNYEDITIRVGKYKSGTTLGLPGAMFDVYINAEKLGRFQSGPDGTVDITPEVYGDFIQKYGWANAASWTITVEEVVPPDGYLLGDDRSQTVEAHQGQKNVEFKFYDVEYPKIKIYKRDVNHPDKMLPGAVFEIKIDGHDIGDRVTDENGEIIIDYKDYSRFLGDEAAGGTFTDEELFSVSVREVRAPEGYLIQDPNWQTKILNRHQSLLTFDFSDMAYPEIWVRKSDSEEHTKHLAGTEFELAIDGLDGPHLQFSTTEDDIKNNDGWHKITWDEFERYLQDVGGSAVDLNGRMISVTELHPTQFYNRDPQLGSPAGRDFTLTGQLGPNQSVIKFDFYDTHYRSLKVTKIDSETGWELKGAEFTLKCVSLEDTTLNNSQASGGWGAGVSRQGLTNAEGYYVFENLPNGIYELTETHPPQGYHGIDDTDSTLRGYWTDDRQPGTKTIQITSASGSDGQPGVQNRVIEYTYANQPKSGLKIYKQDGVNREPIEGAQFRITPLAPLEGEPEEFTTDANGIITVEADLTNGSYMVEEIYVPEPYNLNTTPQYVEIDGRHNAYSLVVNNYADGFVYVKKLDNVTGLPCAGAEFEITTADGKKVDQVRTTDSSGYVKFGPLTPGESYIVTETKAPPGHEITNPNWQSFTVPKNTSGWVKELIFKDDPLANLWLRKVDAETGKGLQGAEFKITDGSGKVVKQNLITDNEGYIKVNGLEKGNYVATEITAPIGYMLPEGSAAETHIYLEYGKTEVILIKNTKPGGLIIRKTDASTREALAGAVFQLYDINDTPIGAPVKTGADGYARWVDLEPGQYQVEEIEAPAGYQRTTERRKFEVKKFVSTEYEWTNAEEATITIYKRDGETFLPLAGAEFEIRKTK